MRSRLGTLAVVVAATFALAACADGIDPLAPGSLVPSAPRKLVTSAGSFDDVRATHFYADGGDCTAWGKRTDRYDIDLLGTNYSTGASTSVWNSYWGNPTVTLNDPIAGLILTNSAPHQNTREGVQSVVRCYTSIGVGTASADVQTITWRYFHNNTLMNACNRTCVDLRLTWTPVSYNISQILMSPATITNGAGTTVSVQMHPQAQNGTEIYNQGGALSSSNTSVATTAAGWMLVPSIYGAEWSVPTVQVQLLAAGTATLTTSISGQTASIPVTVLPVLTFSGAAFIPTNQTNTYSVSASGCNTTCTMHWTVVTNDDSEPPQDLGTFTGTSSSVQLSWGPSSVTVRVDVSSNGVTNSRVTPVMMQENPGGDPSCPPFVIICE